MEITPPGQHPPAQWIVGVGASAGGLEALTAFLRPLPADAPAAIVVVQHMSHTHPSLLVQLLGREAQLPVVEITHGMQPRSGVVHVAPPNHDVIIVESGFALQGPKRDRMPTPSVDAFFRSLAVAHAQRAIGVVLSGTGNDGATGLQAIRMNGGVTYAQDPEAARYAGMPGAAIAADAACFVLGAGEIAEHLLEFIHTGVQRTTSTDEPIETQIARLFRLVKQRTGIRLDGYKSTTLKRRLARRLAATQAADIGAYLDHVEAHPQELDRLQQELLISVTSFFRDKAAFDALEKAIDVLLDSRAPEHSVRVWVAGCATGEEAYSIAILLLEALRRGNRAARPRIFATDIDMPALQHARRGVYPTIALRKVKPTLIERYFEATADGYEIKTIVRDCVTFARHDITAHPPFLRSDIVSCRNLLIYFNTMLQERILPILHYALVADGLMLLGKSESVGPFENLFEPVAPGARLYRSRGPRVVPPPAPDAVAHTAPIAKAPSLSERIAADHTRLSIDRYAPPSVLVAPDGTVMHSLGDVGRFLIFPSGKPVLGLSKLVRDEARTEVQALLHRAARKGGPVSGRSYPDERGGGYRMSVTPVTAARGDCFLVAFEPAPEAVSRPSAPQAGVDPQLEQMLRGEVDALRENLQTVIEELETQNEEMQALNEELQSANEELQSTNEELETSNEELQSTNEELSTVNDELGQRTRETADANADLLALLESLPFPAIVFDDTLHVTRSNAAALRTLHMERATGMSLGELLRAPELEPIRESLSAAVMAREPHESQIMLGERHFKLMTNPCALPSRHATGIVLQLVDVTPIVRTQYALEVSQARLKTVLDNSSMNVVITDIQGRIEYVNQHFLDSVGASSHAALGRRLWDFYAPADANMLRQRHAAAIASETAFEVDDTVSCAGQTQFLHSAWIPLRQDHGSASGVCWKSFDVTERQHAKDALARSEALSRAVLGGMPTELAVLDREGRITAVNERWNRFARENGVDDADQWLGKNYLDYCRAVAGDQDAEGARRGILAVLAGQLPQFELEYPCHGPRTKRWFRMLVVPLELPVGGVAVMHVDITAIREARLALEAANAHLDATVEARTRELRQAVDELEMFMHTVSHDLRNPLRTLVGFTDLVQSNLDGRIDAETSDYLSRISRAALRMNGYLDELLKLSHLTRGDILVRQVDVSRMAREIAQDLAVRHPERRVDVEIADGLAAAADPNLLRGVFENLLDNAWKYTQERNPARIEVGRVERNGRNTIYVRDNGIGFDMAYRDKLFMPFQRLHVQEAYEGTGLGLAAARRIVVRHGGTIDAEARPGYGATFYIWLP